MNDENFNRTNPRPRVLVAPLDWGLGHATRCVPVIHKLINGGFEVMIAAGPSATSLLKTEFPALEFLPLKDHAIRYSRKPQLLLFSLLLQLPRLFLHIYKERRWLAHAIKQYRLDAVISDNRPGLYHPSVPCIYITHQLCIKTGNGFTERLAQKMHYRFINRFHECWVPDFRGENNLAGDLSHPDKIPGVPLLYIGPLSRFEKSGQEKKYRLAVILSGPEPQRSIFEELLLPQLRAYPGKIILVRGLPGNKPITSPGNSSIEIADHLSAADLNCVIEASETIICRSGYSSVMDLVKLDRRAILVPTPGQTEQEYLAQRLKERSLFYCVEQNAFSLDRALNEEAAFVYNPFAFETVAVDLVLSGCLKTLNP